METKVGEFSFWLWLLKGEPGYSSPGWHQLLDKYLILYVLVAMIIKCNVSLSLDGVAIHLMLPMSGMLIGITFAWSGNITALLSSDELSELSDFAEGGLSTYVYSAQLVVLIVLSTSCLWALAGLGIFNNHFYSFMLYTLTCMCIRECWNLILLAQYLTLARKNVQDIKKNNK